MRNGVGVRNEVGKSEWSTDERLGVSNDVSVAEVVWEADGVTDGVSLAEGVWEAVSRGGWFSWG